MLESLLKRSRAPPPPVPPLLDRAAFDTSEAHKAHMQERRRAMERLREYHRPHRDRGGRDQSSRKQNGRNQSGRARPSRERSKTMREAARVETGRRINLQVSVHVGRKRMFSVPVVHQSSPPLLPQPRAAVPTHPVPPAPPLTGSDEDNSFAQLLSLCVPESDLLRLCERASALWHRTRCFNDPRWTDFCYGCGEPPISQSELQTASDIFHFLQLAAHEKHLTSTDHKQAVQSCLHGDQSVTCHLMFWDSRDMNLS